jgi:YesN/AraC family two-component response regulator
MSVTALYNKYYFFKYFSMKMPLVLIVEDDLVSALVIKKVLHQEGYDEVITVVSVEEAINAIESLHPSLVLIDINLNQEKDGIDLGMYLLDRDTIPFIYLTSYADNTTIGRVTETRPYGYIVKPFKPQDLKTTVSIVLSNFKHRFVDVQRQEKEITTDIPFVLKQSIQYINENIAKKITVSDLAKATRWEAQHFTRLFTQYVGVTPSKYIIDKKIEKAKVFLTETALPITQIAFELSIKSHSNFYSMFKKATGKTPEEYRKWQEANNKYIK